MRRHAAAAFAGAFGVLGLGCPPPDAPPVTATAAPVVASARPVPQPPRAGGPVRVVYEEAWFGGVDLLGVDATHTKALVRLDGRNPDRLYVDSIDLTQSVRSDRWDVTDRTAQRAIGGQGFPPGDSMRPDVMRLAGLLAPLGPWHTRAALASPTFAATSDATLVVYGSAPTDGSGGDWLLAIDGAGGAPHRVDEGLAASYSPVISPNGKAIAFRGCNSTPCNYGVFVSKDRQKPRRVPGIVASSTPIFTNDGAHVLAIGDGGKEGRCLFKASLTAVTSADSLFCMRGAADVAFAEDKEGRTAVVSGLRGTPGSQSLDLEWILLEDGSVLGAHTIERGTAGAIVNETGLVAVPMQKGGLAIVDLVSKKQASLPDDGGWFFGFDAAAFTERSLVLLRKPDGAKSYQIVSVDARAMIDAAPPQ